jgi:hypothetical protein
MRLDELAGQTKKDDRLRAATDKIKRLENRLTELANAQRKIKILEKRLASQQPQHTEQQSDPAVTPSSEKDNQADGT